MNKLRLILGDQLNINHSWFRQNEPNIFYVLMEIRSETDYVKHHIQKIVALFHAMREFHLDLKNKEFNVTYIKINDLTNQHSFSKNISKLIQDLDIGVVEYQEPDEYRVDQDLKKLSDELTIPVTCYSSEHFLAERDFCKKFFEGKKQWRMEFFYREMRKKYNILLDENNEPEGGRWNYDSENRNKWNHDPKIIEDDRPVSDVTEIYDDIKSQNIDFIGEIDPKQFRWPKNRDEAMYALDQFINFRLINFGQFQDAMHEDEKFLFHSLLSFSLNTKMISPLEVIQEVEKAYKEKKISLASIEGFIRQVLGWREYIRGVYWAYMPGYDQQNYFSSSRKLPNWFWTGKTKMNCLKHSIHQSLHDAYAHHIQRLMVVGNFSLLVGIDPKEIHAWYLGIYIDAFEWVELPNTLGMSQFADGGILASKPYVSSGSYIDKMSNYCKNCHYKVKDKLGENACPFNSLYWSFMARHQSLLSNNQRLGITYNQLKKMDPIQKDAILHQAELHLSNIDNL